MDATRERARDQPVLVVRAQISCAFAQLAFDLLLDLADVRLQVMHIGVEIAVDDADVVFCEDFVSGVDQLTLLRLDLEMIAAVEEQDRTDRRTSRLVQPEIDDAVDGRLGDLKLHILVVRLAHGGAIATIADLSETIRWQLRAVRGDPVEMTVVFLLVRPAPRERDGKIEQRKDLRHLAVVAELIDDNPRARWHSAKLPR